MNDLAQDPTDFPHRMFALSKEFGIKVGNVWSMVSHQSSLPPGISDGSMLTDDENPYAIGAKKSFVPVLGEIVWELPQALAAQVPFSAYVCRVDKGQQVGYVRVPHYTYNERDVNVFADLIARFESTTTALVLDQVNNPGGSMFHMYAMLSTLTNRALVLPTHQLVIDDDAAAMAAETVALAEADEAVPSDDRPSPELVAYSRFVLSEREAGRGTGHRRTNPVHLCGVAEILPAERRYTKKVVVLINELDFSAAEFLAAILQDNKRAILFGERTAGAGGCVKRITLPNSLGMCDLTVSWTRALRTNGQPIQNIGVHPDVRYSILVEDICSGYTSYRRTLLATIAAQ